MTDPYQQWGQGMPAGQYPGAPMASGPPPAQAPGWAGYPGQQPPRGSGLDLGRIGAAILAVAGLVVLFGSLASLYSVTVTPSALDVKNNDAPTGAVKVAIGFYDMVPFAPPIVAQAIPVLMLLAALTALPVALGSVRATVLPAVFSGAATLLGLVLAISNPLPSVQLSGEMATELSKETGGQTIDKMVDAVVSISPGAGVDRRDHLLAAGLGGRRLADDAPRSGRSTARARRTRLPGPSGVPGRSGVPSAPGHPRLRRTAERPRRPGDAARRRRPVVVVTPTTTMTRVIGAAAGLIALLGLAATFLPMWTVAIQSSDMIAGGRELRELGIAPMSADVRLKVGFYDWFVSSQPAVAVLPLALAIAAGIGLTALAAGVDRRLWAGAGLTALAALVIVMMTAIQPESRREVTGRLADEISLDNSYLNQASQVAVTVGPGLIGAGIAALVVAVLAGWQYFAAGWGRPQPGFSPR